MRPHKRLFLIHQDRTGRTHNFPWGSYEMPELTRFPKGIRGCAPRLVIVINVIIEFSVLKHLRPYAAVNAAPEMFDELAVNVRGDPASSIFRINDHLRIHSLVGDQFERHIVEPGFACSQPKSAEQ